MRWLQHTGTRSTGQAAERQAEQYLQSHGLRSLQRNFHTRGGEIDLIMQEGHTLVFVEVRFRQDTSRGSALETVTVQKQARIRQAASRFLQEHPALAESPCRFDVVGMEPDATSGHVTIRWIRDAFA